MAFNNFSVDELQEACEQLKLKGSGPGGNLLEEIKLFIKKYPAYLLAIYNELDRKALFSEKWEAAKLAHSYQTETTNADMRRDTQL